MSQKRPKKITQIICAIFCQIAQNATRDHWRTAIGCLGSIYLKQFGSSLLRLLSRALKCKRVKTHSHCTCYMVMKQDETGQWNILKQPETELRNTLKQHETERWNTLKHHEIGRWNTLKQPERERWNTLKHHETELWNTLKCSIAFF